MENQQQSELYPKGGEVTFIMPNTNVIGTLKNAKKGASLTAKYMTAEDWAALKGKEQRCFYLGLKEAADSDGKVYYLAKLHNGTMPFVAAQTILVQSLANLPIGQGVSITCTGVDKAVKGKIVGFEVADLGINFLGSNNE
ncbi:hypothetical protein ATE49_12885 [Elizabethkingia miricola]|uniref:Uncharacterized protein n=1 Tax=Elizabethkingia miricola TaxID=172045 RepID=A0ABY3NBB2_ELIMR|nr:hypothetical protein [Elizabethkingia miricola]OBS13338.1 hypothetical protein ATE49_12885 [Elizabethkingia miricola]TYO84972.1 hypothetical protein LX74_03777 [Elizabethkingia miricola]